MRIVTTTALGMTVIAFAIVTAVVDRKPDSGKRAAVLANVLVRFDPAKIDRVEIEKAGALTVVIKRSGFWFFAEPEKDRVDAGLMAGLLDKINNLTVLDRLVGTGDGADPQETGLEGDAVIRVTLAETGEKGNAKVEETVFFGHESPRTDTLYARGRDGGETLVVQGNPRPWLESPLESLLDRRLLGAPVEAIVQLVIRSSHGEVALQRRITPPKQDWAMIAPIKTWADHEVLDRLLTDIGAMRLEEVVVDADLASAIPDPLPENSAVFQIQLYGIESPLTIFLKEIDGGQDGTPLVEARVSDRPAVYRFRSDILSKIPKEPNELRDRSLARIPLNYLDSITIQSRTDPLVFLKSDRSSETPFWEVKLNNKLIPANFTAVSALVNAVNEAAIRDFTSDSATELSEYGLEPPARRVIFNLVFPGQPLPDGSPGQVQEVSRVLNLGWREGDQNRLFANLDGEPHVYELEPTFVNYLPTHPIKWRSLNVLSFNPIHLRSITREYPDKEMLKLQYDYRRDQWQASSSGVDVTSNLDLAAARRLRDRLGSLTASGWILSLGQAYEALQNPSLQFNIVTTELDPAINEPVDVTHLVKFAPSASNIYFGQIEGSPDVFYLDRDTYLELIRPVTAARGQNP